MVFGSRTSINLTINGVGDTMCSVAITLQLTWRNKMKFASKRVIGWNERYLNMSKIAHQLYSRVERGYSLALDEQQFLNEYKQLALKYNK